jgi:hypothetical protein
MLTTILEPLSIIIITKNEEGYIGKSLDKLTNAIEVWGGKAELFLLIMDQKIQPEQLL